MISNIIENHDEPREVSVTIFLRRTAVRIQGKLTGRCLFSAEGNSVYLSGAQEIGMENMEFTSMDQIDDINTIDEYQVALRAGCSEKALDAASAFSRDNARTPVQWAQRKMRDFQKESRGFRG